MRLEFITLLICIQFVVISVVNSKENMPNPESAETIRFPAESELHERTFMAWPGNSEIWGGRLLRLVQADIARIAKAIVNFEPVTVIVSPKDYAAASKMLGSKIDLLKIPVDDLWARDTVPVFTIQNGKTTLGVDFNFNGWGRKQTHSADGALAAKLLNHFKIPRVRTWLVTEGGSLETDGEGTLLVTESSIIHHKRNPGKSKAEIEAELKRVLGVKKVIWFKGVAGKDITDGHVDSFVRFTKPGRVVLTRPFPSSSGPDKDDVWTKCSAEAFEILSKETDAQGRKFEIVEIFEPDWDKIKMVGNGDSFVASYVNFFVANGGVIIPKFGDRKADREAQETLRKEFPGREIVAVEISALASGGGGIHCATHELPEIELIQALEQ